MGGIFGTISKKSCVADVFYGTDYNSHLGTRRGGLAMYSKEKGFSRSIHNLESSYFRTKFEPTLDRFEGSTAGIGVISAYHQLAPRTLRNLHRSKDCKS